MAVCQKEITGSNIRIAAMPASGHVNPMLAIVRKLVERGHTVHWYCARPLAARINAVGALRDEDVLIVAGITEDKSEKELIS